jgi:hypothetical protein
MDDFGRRDPRQMPRHLFQGSLRLDYGTAVRANVERQNCSICPHYWYVDVVFRCERCGAEFTFSAAEQRVWYEEYEFWIDAIPKHCLDCRHTLRELKLIRQEYDRTVAQVLNTGDLEAKQRLASVIDQLYEMGGELPSRINETRRRLANEISKTGRDAT